MLILKSFICASLSSADGDDDKDTVLFSFNRQVCLDVIASSLSKVYTQDRCGKKPIKHANNYTTYDCEGQLFTVDPEGHLDAVTKDNQPIFDRNADWTGLGSRVVYLKNPTEGIHLDDSPFQLSAKHNVGYLFGKGLVRE